VIIDGPQQQTDAVEEEAVARTTKTEKSSDGGRTTTTTTTTTHRTKGLLRTKIVFTTFQLTALRTIMRENRPFGWRE